MRILVDLTALADNFSGIERYAACLTRELMNCGNEDYILIFKEKIHPMFLDFRNHERVKMIILPGCNKLFFNQVRLPLEIYKHRADRYLFPAFPVPVLLFKKNMISTIHDICCWDCPETMNGMSNWYFKISHMVAMKKCKAIITISEFSKGRIVERLKYPREKLLLIYCGVDGKFLSYKEDIAESKRIKEKYGLPEKYLLSLSTLEPRKNIGLLVREYAALVDEKRMNIPLVLAGRRGWKMDDLLDGVSDEAKSQIHFTGFVDEDDLAAVYGNASLFIFPSMYEGFGLPPLEALACGTAVLSSDSTSLPEILGSGVFYFRNNDGDDLRKQMETIGLSAESISVNRSRAQAFSWSVEAGKLLEALEWNA